MMKNSKLSKLLVAGVSVAVLASAFAPMAFAEGEGSGTDVASTTPLTVKVISKVGGSYYVADVTAKDSATMGRWTEMTNGSTKYVEGIFDAGTLSSGESVSTDTVDLGELLLDEDYVGTGTWTVCSYESGSNVYALASTSGVFKVADLYNASLEGGSGSVAGKVQIIWNATAAPTASVKHPVTGWNNGTNTGIDATGSVNKELTVVHADSDVDDTTVTVNNTATPGIKLTDTLVMPTYKLEDGYAYDEITITVFQDTTPLRKLGGYKMGDKVAVSSLVSSDEFKKGTIVIEVADGIYKIKGVTATLPDYSNAANAKVDYVNKDGKEKFDGLDTITGASFAPASNDDLKAIAEWESKVYYGETRNLPNYVVMTEDEDGNDVVDTDWTFDRWVISCSNGDLLANGKPANGYVLEGNVFDPSVFKATTTEGDTDLTLVPVFTKADEPADVITYDPAKTPNDKVTKYINGKATSEKVVWGVANEFKGGLFYNEVDETFAYYLPLNTKGKWEIDTTVNGVADGVFFADGKQDTEAYGLKKVSGAAEDDKFFYLVSDGLYVDDYTDIWVDEDGSIYNLINGCTSDVPFTGIVEKDGWATSVKDSKVDDKANGFILYGETQYWFINGTCNLNETEAVREHTDGNFYYTVGAKIDFTFNGECNGHTFVNGVASK